MVHPGLLHEHDPPRFAYLKMMLKAPKGVTRMAGAKA